MSHWEGSGSSAAESAMFKVGLLLQSIFFIHYAAGYIHYSFTSKWLLDHQNLQFASFDQLTVQNTKIPIIKGEDK